MSTQLQLRRGTTAQHSTFTGASGEITIDTDKKTVVVHDGTTAGGRALPQFDSSGNLGIGTSSSYGIGTRTISLNNTTSVAIELAKSGSASSYIWTDGSKTAFGTYASTPLVFETNQTERMRLDSSGNLGIGVTPSAWNSSFNVFQIGATGSLYGRANTGYDQAGFYSNARFASGTNDWRYLVTATASGYGQAGGAHYWYTAPSGTAGNAITFTEAMTLDANGLKINATMGTATTPFQVGYTSGGTYYPRLKLDDNGNLLVGTTSSAYAYANASFRWASGIVMLSRDTTGDTNQIAFFNPNGAVGSINTNGSATYYNTSSDYRLKEDYQPVADAIVRLNQLKPINFAWKVDGSRCDGFLAHELQEVIPEAATGHKDEMRTEEYEITPKVEATFDEEGNELTPAVEAVMGEREVPVYQGIDQSKIVPLLTAALQEAVAKIESQSQTIESLTQRIEALEYTKQGE